MADVFSEAKRSQVMASIRWRWTKPERLVHNLLKGRRIRHRMHPPLAGNPDVLVYPSTVLFIDGCFWHGCPRCHRPPKSRTEYWLPKIAANKARDRRNRYRLRREGWIVLQLWEHQLKNLDLCLRKMATDIESIDGNEVRRVRGTLGLTQAQYAKKLGTSRDEVGRWERGRKPIPERIKRLIVTMEQERQRNP